MVPNPMGLGSFSPNTQHPTSQGPLLLRRLCCCANRIPSPRQSSRELDLVCWVSLGSECFSVCFQTKNPKISLANEKKNGTEFWNLRLCLKSFFLCLNRNTASLVTQTNLRQTWCTVYGISCGERPWQIHQV